MQQFIFGSYNLKEGGLDGGHDARLGDQLSMLKEAGADAWALQECTWTADRYGYLHFAEDVLGMRGFLAKSNHGCDVAILVRDTPEIRIHARHYEESPPFWHALMYVEVRINEFPYSLISAHLAPSSPALRAIEAEAFALTVQRGAGPVIAGGDWNAVPAADPDPETSDVSPAVARRKLDRSPALAIEETGLLDVAACLGDPTPTVGHDSGLYYRCDRLYTSLPRAALRDYRVIAEDRPKSDHLAVIGRFDLDAARVRAA